MLNCSALKGCLCARECASVCACAAAAQIAIATAVAAAVARLFAIFFARFFINCDESRHKIIKLFTHTRTGTHTRTIV